MLTHVAFHRMMMKSHHKCLICYRLPAKENLVSLNYTTAMDVIILSHHLHL